MFKDFLINYSRKRPISEIQDYIKYIYQSTFGGEHLITSKETVYQYLLTECNQIDEESSSDNLYDVISEKYVRVNLSPYIKGGFSLSSLNDAFCSQSNNNSLNDLQTNLSIFESLVENKTIDLDLEKVKTFLKEYKDNYYPVFHHTSVYRKHYNPHYRVLPTSFITNEMKEFQLLLYIERLYKNNTLTFISVEGKCGSGKTTTVNNILKKTPLKLTVLHADDFFLTNEDKKIQTEIGDYIDYKRILKGMENVELNGKLTLEKYDCKNRRHFKCNIENVSPIIILEGVYSHNKHLSNLFNNLVYINIDKEEQLKRITNRCQNKDLLNRFINEWIPMENKYYESFELVAKADIII